MIRKLRLPLAALALSLSCLSASAHAQVGVYGMFTVDRQSGISSSPVLQTLSPLPCPQPSNASCTSYNNYVNPLGFTGGVFYDFKRIGPVTLGGDLRGSVVNTHRGAQVASDGSGAHIYSGLAGVRASFKTPLSYLKPYAQGSVGYARSNYGVLTDSLHNGTVYPTNPLYPGVPTQNNLEYHVYAGTDLQLFPYADWRVFEAGYGALTATGNFGHTYPVLSISTGIVLHFGR